MLILAFESSAKPASVAVYKTSAESDVQGKLLGQYFQNNGFSHSRTLMAMVESLLKNLEIKPAELGLVAVARGPGSFTGVRIGVSAAKGLAAGLEIPICGVSTLEAMAYQQQQNPDVVICAVMDARRQQVYNALFKWKNGSLVRLCEDRAISLEELAAELSRQGMPYMLVGDGVSVAEKYLNNAINTPELLHYQTAYGVVLAALHTNPIPAAELEPYYLRPSQAERELIGCSYS